jgi:predicted ester cyclase
VGFLVTPSQASLWIRDFRGFDMQETPHMADLKELSQRSVEAYNAHDASKLATLDHQDVVTTAPGPKGRTELRGRKAGQDYNQSWFTAFPDAKITIINEVIASDTFVQEGIFKGTNTGEWKSEAGDMPATGKTVNGQFCLVAKVRDGLIVSGNLYFDQVDLMTQLGLMPVPAEARA